MVSNATRRRLKVPFGWTQKDFREAIIFTVATECKEEIYAALGGLGEWLIASETERSKTNQEYKELLMCMIQQ